MEHVTHWSEVLLLYYPHLGIKSLLMYMSLCTGLHRPPWEGPRIGVCTSSTRSRDQCIRPSQSTITLMLYIMDNLFFDAQKRTARGRVNARVRTPAISVYSIDIRSLKESWTFLRTQRRYLLPPRINETLFKYQLSKAKDVENLQNLKMRQNEMQNPYNKSCD